MSLKRDRTTRIPANTPTKSPASPSGTAAPRTAPTPKPPPADRTIVATSRLPATAPRIVGGLRSVIGRGLGGIEIGHESRTPPYRQQGPRHARVFNSAGAGDEPPAAASGAYRIRRACNSIVTGRRGTGVARRARRDAAGPSGCDRR